VSQVAVRRAAFIAAALAVFIKMMMQRRQPQLRQRSLDSEAESVTAPSEAESVTAPSISAVPSQELDFDGSSWVEMRARLTHEIDDIADAAITEAGEAFAGKAKAAKFTTGFKDSTSLNLMKGSAQRGHKPA